MRLANRQIRCALADRPQTISHFAKRPGSGKVGKSHAGHAAND